MHALNPMFQNTFSGTDYGMPGRRHAWGHQHAPGQLQQVNSSGTVEIERTLALAYEKLQVTATRNVPGSESTTATPSDTDFSPQAVTDRVLGFISDRLESERANGATDADIQALYQQAIKGVEQGLREAKDIIQAQGLFSGEVKDNFYSTVTKLADGLEALGEALFGVDLEAPSSSGNAVVYQGSQVAFDRARSFDMQVVTQDGDTVTLHVSSGQSGYANQFSLQADGVSAQGFDAGFSSYDNVSFSVEGELDEGELAALRDLFSQVNTVAETFYGGDVETAFNQAMDVGMDSEELASFAVDINQSQAVAVRDTYVAINDMAAGPRTHSRSDVMPRLGEFAKGVREAGERVQSMDAGRLEAPQLLRELIARFHSDGDSDQGHGQQFKRFIEALA